MIMDVYGKSCLAQGWVDQIGPDFVSGWYYRASNHCEACQIEVLLDGIQIASSSSDHQREDLKVRGFGNCAFHVDLPPFFDVLSLLVCGSLEVRARLDENNIENIAFSSSFLHPAILRSSALLFGDRACSAVLTDLILLSKHGYRNQNIKTYAAQLCDLLRVFFTPNNRPANFNQVAESLSRAAGREAAANFYRNCEVNPSELTHTQPSCNTNDLRYARYTSLVDAHHLLPIQAQKCRFITGEIDGGYLMNEGGLAGIATEAEPGEPALANHHPSLWFGLQSFGDNHWRCITANGEVNAPYRFYLIDFDQLRDIIDRGGTLVIDQSAEGPPAHSEWVSLVNLVVADLGLINSHLVVNQNFAFLEFGADRGLTTPFVPGHVFFLRGARELDALFPDQSSILAYIDNTLTKRNSSTTLRKFACLNFTPRWPRWAFGLFLCRGGYIPDGFFSFPGRSSSKASVEGSIADILPPLRTRELLISVIDLFLSGSPYIVDTDVRCGPSPLFVFPEEVASNSLLHIVTETEMSSGEVLRVTEKMLKPIVALQPFIIVGNPRSLEIMRNMGFKTFDHVFDESYDQIYHYIDRFDALETLVCGLLSQDVGTLHLQLQAAEDACIYNFLHLLRIWPALMSKSMPREIVRAILRNSVNIV